MAEDDLYSIIDVGDIVLSKHFQIDHFDPKVAARLDDTNRGLQNFVGKLFPNGTCFIISKTSKDIRINNRKVVALATTNFHTAYYLETRNRNNCMNTFFHERIYKHGVEIEVLFEFNTLCPDMMISKSTGEEYCYPSDLAIIAIYEEKWTNKLIQLSFATEEEIITAATVLISSHPYTSNLRNVFPKTMGADDNAILSAFHNFRYQVNSLGVVRNHCESGLLEIEFSAISGMAGAPILIGEWPNCKIAGIYCGGPPLSGQRLITMAIDALIYEDFEGALLISKQFPFLDQEVYERSLIFEQVMANFASLANAIARKANIKDIVPFTVKSLLKALHESVFKIKDKSLLAFNVGISVKSRCFRKLRHVVAIFEEIENLQFDSPESFAEFLLVDQNTA